MVVHMLHSSGQSLGDKELRLTAMSLVHLIEVTHVANRSIAPWPSRRLLGRDKHLQTSQCLGGRPMSAAHVPVQAQDTGTTFLAKLSQRSYLTEKLNRELRFLVANLFWWIHKKKAFRWLSLLRFSSASKMPRRKLFSPPCQKTNCQHQTWQSSRRSEVVRQTSQQDPVRRFLCRALCPIAAFQIPAATTELGSRNKWS